MLRRACPSCSLAHIRECPIIGASIMTSYAQLADAILGRGVRPFRAAISGVEGAVSTLWVHASQTERAEVEVDSQISPQTYASNAYAIRTAKAKRTRDRQMFHPGICSKSQMFQCSFRFNSRHLLPGRYTPPAPLAR